MSGDVWWRIGPTRAEPAHRARASLPRWLVIGMPISNIVVGVFGTLMGIWSLFLVPRAWRGYFTRRETRYRGQLRTHGELGLIWWPFGEATRSGAIRGFVVLTFWWCVALLGYWVIQVSQHSAGSVSHVTRIVAELLFGLCAVLFALALTVMFFNWPKFVVPPPSRGESGAVAEWHHKKGHNRQG